MKYASGVSKSALKLLGMCIGPFVSTPPAADTQPENCPPASASRRDETTMAEDERWDHRIELRASFDAAPATVFSHLHEPSKLKWLGPFRLVRQGVDSGVPSGLGSVRRVSFIVPIVEETITRFEPPCALDYRVTLSRAFEKHHATMRLRSREGGGSHLTWIVRFDSARGNAKRHERFIRWFLSRALQRLERRLRQQR